MGAADGALWVGTLEGLSRLDRERKAVRTFRRDPKDPASLSASDVGRLFRDSAGTLWVVFRGGAIDSMEPDGSIRHRRAGLDAAGVVGNVTAAAGSRDGRTFLGTSTGALLSWDPKEGRFRRVPGVEPGKPITALLEGSGGTLWVGTRGAGLLRHDALLGVAACTCG